MRTKSRSIATFHRPIHSHWSLPLRWPCFLLSLDRNFPYDLPVSYHIPIGYLAFLCLSSACVTVEALPAHISLDVGIGIIQRQLKNVIF
jgi:hypothetical protein